jgi:hypothetical protein
MTDKALETLEILVEGSRRDLIDNWLEREMGSVREKHMIDGLLVAPADALQKVRDAKEDKYYAELRASAAWLQKRIPQIFQTIDAQIAAARKLKPVQSATPEGRAALRTADLLERQEARLLLAGRTPEQLRDFYRRTSDTEQPALVAWLEEEMMANLPTIALRSSGDAAEDVGQMRGWLREIRARGDARVPARLRALRAKLTQALSSGPEDPQGRTKRILIATIAQARPRTAACVDTVAVPAHSERNAGRVERTNRRP